MALRVTPPGEDPLRGTRGLPVSFSGPGTPPDGGADVVGSARAPMRASDNGAWSQMAGTNPADELENEAAAQAESAGYEPDHGGFDFLSAVAIAEEQAQLYTAQVNRRAWSQSYRAFHNEHYVGSKYTRPEWRNRSRLFVPKTRGAVRKDMATVAASLFNSIDAINCLPGNEADDNQRAAASIMEELVNYRTDRTSGKASFPWFQLSMGARHDALITGICLTKQYWKTDYRKVKEETYLEANEETGEHQAKIRDVYTVETDRPDMALFPPECFVIHPGADWLNPVQTAAYVVLKYPMTYDEIKLKQDAPLNPWKQLSEAELRQAAVLGKQDMEAIRRAREVGLDRYDETQTGTEFQIIWVYEVFMRVGGEDWQFWSVGNKYFLTDPMPVREAYPEQAGDRPLSLGYGSLEPHRIFPMSPVESWQPLQVETNDLRNLMLDAIKQNVMPVSKVRRGRRIDLDQVRRRSYGSTIFVDDPTDVTWEQPPSMPQDSAMMSRDLSVEMDDLAGVQNYGNVEQQNALGKTLGGLKLAAGAANSVQEFDIRVWITTWAEPALGQIVRLEQYYESDPIVLSLCGQRAQLFEKFGVNEINDQLLEQQVTVRVSVGLGAGDPQQRLAKFQSAAQIVAPIIQASPEFQSGQREINVDAIIEEVFGAVGYKDGGARFFKSNPGPRPNPMMDLKTKELEAKIAKDDRTGRAAMFTGLSALAKVALGKHELEADTVDMLLGHQHAAHEMGFEHGDRAGNTHLAARDHGHRHEMEILEHRRNMRNDAHAQELAQQQAEQEQQGEGAGTGKPPSSRPPRGGGTSSASPQGSPSAPSPQKVQFIRGPDGRISHAVLPEGASLAPVNHGGSDHDDRLARLEAIIAKLGGQA